MGYLQGRDRVPQLGREYDQTRTVALLGALLVAAGLGLVGGWILTLFGDFEDALPILWILAATWVGQASFGMNRSYLGLAGYAGWTLSTSLFVLPVNVALNILLIPRWGGSYAAMEQFATEADGLWDRNPRLQSLHGFAHWDRGRVYWADRDTTSALLEHAKALAFGDLWQFRLELGKLNYRIDQYEEALSNLDRALAQRPVWVEALLFRAKTHYALGRMANGAEKARLFSAAFRDIELAARLDPMDERVRNSREFYKKWIPQFAPQAVR